jgi:hypothetical protein
MKWEKSISCNFRRYVDKELVVDAFPRLRWSVHESTFPLQQNGVPYWYHNVTFAKPVSGAQFATPLW